MIEVKVLLDDIDYESIAESMVPVVKEKLAENSNSFGGFVGKHLPESALNGAANGFLKFLSQKQKDELALKLIKKYEKRIIETLRGAAADRGISVDIKELSASIVKESQRGNEHGHKSIQR